MTRAAKQRRATQDPLEICEVRQLLDKVAALAEVRNSDFDDEAETRKKLHAHGIGDEEIARQLATLQRNSAGSTAVLTSYSLLHSLQHLDAIQHGAARHSESAEAIISIFRCAEICLYTIGVLSNLLRINIEQNNISKALPNMRWRVGFQEIVYKLSSLIVEVQSDPQEGIYINIQDSQIYQSYQAETIKLQKWLMTQWREDDGAIFNKDLDDPRRYIFFHEYINVSDERTWLGRLTRVKLPGAAAADGETAAQHHARIICSAELEAMLTALETKADTDLLPFRVIHQISELIAGYVNQRLHDVIRQLLAAAASPLDAALRQLCVCNRLLTIVDESIRLLMRALTPRAYKDIRPNLGMVRGTSSVVLRKVLFNTTYPLLVRAFKLRLLSFDPSRVDDDEAVFQAALALTQSPDAASAQVAAVMRQLVVLYQHIRSWRDHHQQLPKTHLGKSALHGQPTVSLSGSDSAADIAHELRKTHAADPIAPLFRAALGAAPPALHELLTPGGFDEHMAQATARAVFDVYADVQSRFYDRRQKNKTRPPRKQ